jgi:predicted RNA-binding protein associated with RNAse of E/G family
MPVIEEIKEHKNKETQRFLCNVLHREPNYLVVSFHSEKEGNIKDIVIPSGSTTIAHYWTDRGYVLWRMNGPEGLPIGTLFHIVKDVIIASTHVQYLDLIVDIWIAPDGKLRVLDEDELEVCKKAELISIEEEQWIGRQKTLILHTHAGIIKALWNN